MSNLHMITLDTTPDDLLINSGLNIDTFGSTAGKTVHLQNTAQIMGLSPGTHINLLERSLSDITLTLNGSTIEIDGTNNERITSFALNTGQSTTIQTNEGAFEVTLTDATQIQIGDQTYAPEDLTTQSLTGSDIQTDDTLSLPDFDTTQSAPENPNAHFITLDTTPSALTIPQNLHPEFFGSTTGKTITLEAGAKVSGLSQGTDIVLSGIQSNDITANLNGSVLEISNADNQVLASVAAGSNDATITFDDGSASFVLDDSTNPPEVTLGQQDLSSGSVPGSDLTLDAPDDSQTAKDDTVNVSFTGDEDSKFSLDLQQTSDVISMPTFRANPDHQDMDGEGYSVVVIDTGIDLDHPHFGPDSDGDGVADRIVYHQDFTNDGDSSADDVHRNRKRTPKFLCFSPSLFLYCI
mgnify:FL=1